MSFRVHLEAVSKNFGEVQALHPLTAQLGPGERIALMGHNGAGKTTLLTVIASLSKASTGNVHYLDGDRELKKKPEIRQRLSLLSHQPMLYPDLSILENFLFFSRMYDLGLSKDAILDHLDAVGMSGDPNRLVRACSQGMTQRLAFARAMLHRPELLLLDEPFSGLDIRGIERVQKLLRDFSGTVVMVSHEVDHCHALMDEFWILRRGRLVKKLQRTQYDRAQLEAEFRSELPEEL
ncbi:MAG: ABC transporter ATP-binding protein [Acidobacteria bacterium]|nr:ABC transporter ATP-binding protein [Acidobacteriota bacterium]MCB9399368.1 ABC transporter ATP-binding protein [Acidobacteriota bacterium]